MPAFPRQLKIGLPGPLQTGQLESFGKHRLPRIALFVPLVRDRHELLGDAQQKTASRPGDGGQILVQAFFVGEIPPRLVKTREVGLPSATGSRRREAGNRPPRSAGKRS